MNARNQLWLLTFFGFGVNYMLRININIAIVDMVQASQKDGVFVRSECDTGVGNQSSSSLDPNILIRSAGDKVQGIKYQWDEYEQNVILSSYFWLHCVTQLPGGILAHYYGTKKVVGLSNFLVALLTFIIPFSASYGFHVLFWVRMLQGFFAGAFWPSMPSMVAKWIPPKERVMFMSSYLGSSVGTAFTYFICGYIIDWYGWEYVFYVTGSLGLTWCIAWAFMVSDSPEQHPWISASEREYIEDSLGDTVNKNKLSIPWMKILSSRPVWINIIAQWGANGALFALMTHTPMYLKYIHGLHIRSTGVWSGFPHLTRWLFALIFGLFSQYQQFMSVKYVRKLATGLCTIGVAVIVLGLAFSRCYTTLAVILLILAITLQGTIPAGPLVSVIDMSPNFAGVLQGVSGIIAVSPGFMYPFLVGHLTQHNQTSLQWEKFFCIMSGLTCGSGLLYMFFGTSEVQSWNSEKRAEKEIRPLHRSGHVYDE